MGVIRGLRGKVGAACRPNPSLIRKVKLSLPLPIVPTVKRMGSLLTEHTPPLPIVPVS